MSRCPPRKSLHLVLLPKAVQLWCYDGGDPSPCTEWEFFALSSSVVADESRTKKEEDYAISLRTSACDECDHVYPIKRLRLGKTYPWRATAIGCKDTLFPIILPRQAIPIEELSRRSVKVPDALRRERNELAFKLPDCTGCVPVPWKLNVQTRSQEGSNGNLPATTLRQSHPIPGDVVVSPWTKDIDEHAFYSEGPDVETPDRRDLIRLNRVLVEKGRWFSGTVIRHSFRYDSIDVPTVLVEFEDGNRKWIPRVLVVPIPRDGPMVLRPWSRMLHSFWPSSATKEAVLTALLCQVRLRNDKCGSGQEVTTLADIGELLVDEILPFAMPPHWPKVLSAYESSENRCSGA